MNSKINYTPEIVQKVCKVLWHEDEFGNNKFDKKELENFDVNLIEYIEVKKSVENLDPIFQELLQLIFFVGMRHSQISEKLSIPELYISVYLKIIINRVCFIANKGSYKSRVMNLDSRVEIIDGIWKGLVGRVIANLGDSLGHVLVALDFGVSKKIVLIPKNEYLVL